MRLRLLVTSLISLLALACGGPQSSAAPKPAAPAHSAPALHQGPLTDYVAAAGLRWMVVGRPQELARIPGLLATLAPLLPRERLDGFSKTSGVDLRRLPSALVAGFDFSTLYMAETPQENRQVEILLSERMLAGPRMKQPHPKLTRLTGVVSNTPEMLVRVDQRFVAVAIGDPTPARVVEAFARKRLRESPVALAGSALRGLPDLSAKPVRFYVPGPFQGEWLTGARGLLAGATALAVTIEVPNPDQILVEVLVAGDWSEPDAKSYAREAWADLASSSLGSLLALENPLSEPVITASSELLRLKVALPLKPIISGLHAAVGADVDEIMRPGSNDPVSAPPSIPKKNR